MVPIDKRKGKIKDTNNHHGVCLLAMGSRILARVLASRLRWWAEHMQLTDDNQCGFCPGRSTADATQILIRMEEDVEDLRRQRRERDCSKDPAAIQLDFRKAYPRVSKPALWDVLERCGLKGNFLNTPKDLKGIDYTKLANFPILFFYA